jgi:hypothetical protein
VEVVAGDKKRPTIRDVFPPLDLPTAKREHDYAYDNPAEIIDPMHLIVIIARREKIRQTAFFKMSARPAIM